MNEGLRPKDFQPITIRTKYLVIPEGEKDPQWYDTASGVVLGKACFGMSNDAGKFEKLPFVFEPRSEIPNEYKSKVREMTDGAHIHRSKVFTTLPYDEHMLADIGV